MGLLDRFRRKSSEDPEVVRRRALLANGRLTDGTVIETEAEDGREMVRYEYSVQGVEFESCEFLTDEQLGRPQDYAPGATIGIRYDPRNHSNSIVV
ncbi:MAG: DUF3592 domain-containing protein [Acidobacteria bacterium]|nr:MAG: DUF3592 domain-containing protein [Acidobacteriota bacterium]REK01816.1 MAG: DUF3592 domain-containing protein [Acidobacteriota bacterium]REK14772.1 MAG: DUF3592 domain-containing protein [Acidobacteriota bacterium]REK45487.1 MAG: DUF3592 domain-containing protein [Acidobacteriota bacterium]